MLSFAQYWSTLNMERKKASDYPQELLDLFDRYVHGEIDRRDFLEARRSSHRGRDRHGDLGKPPAELRLGAAGSEGR